MSELRGGRRRRLATEALVVVAGLAAATAPGSATSRAEDPPPAAPTTQTIESSSRGEAVLTLPASWKVEQRPGSGEDAMGLTIRPGDGPETVGVRVFSHDRIRNARGNLVAQLPYHTKRRPPQAHGYGHEPVEHLWIEEEKPPHDRLLLAMRHSRRRCIVLVCDVPAALWDATRPALLEAARTATTRLEDCVERPAGYRPLERDGWLYLLHPDAKKDDVAAFHRRALEVERDFAKTWGPVPRLPENPLEIWFHRSKEDAEALIVQRYVKGYSKSSVYADLSPGVLIAWRPPADDALAQADLRMALTSLFFVQTFDLSPGWLSATEELLAWNEGYCGRGLPSVPDAQQHAAAGPPKPFADIVELSAGMCHQERPSLLAYAALFRCGPKAYRDPWDAFVAEMRRTGDWRTAQQGLLALDQAKLAKDAETFRAKSLKPVKPKSK